MKTSIAGIELKYVIDELKAVIGGKIDKIYHPGLKELLLQIHVPSEGKKIIRLVAGKILFLTASKPEAGEPDSFCNFIRKQLTNSRVLDIKQIGAERIVLIEFDTLEGIRRLYIELFGKGNFILCDKEDKIINVEERQEWKDRSIKKDEIYRHPKKEYDFNSINADNLGLLLAGNEIVKVLATELGLGGIYAEEVCLLAKVDKDKKELSKAELEKVVNAVKEIANRKAEPVIAKKDGKVKDILPFKLELYKDFEFEKIDNLSKVLDEIYSKELAEEEKEKGLKSYNEKLKKMETVMREQEKTVMKYKKEYESDIQTAEKIYSNYQLISEVLNELKNAKKKFSNEEINEKLKGHKTVKEVTKEGKVKVVVD